MAALANVSPFFAARPATHGDDVSQSPPTNVTNSISSVTTSTVTISSLDTPSTGGSAVAPTATGVPVATTTVVSTTMEASVTTATHVTSDVAATTVMSSSNSKSSSSSSASGTTSSDTGATAVSSVTSAGSSEPTTDQAGGMDWSGQMEVRQKLLETLAPRQGLSHVPVGDERLQMNYMLWPLPFDLWCADAPVGTPYDGSLVDLAAFGCLCHHRDRQFCRWG